MEVLCVNGKINTLFEDVLFFPFSLPMASNLSF